MPNGLLLRKDQLVVIDDNKMLLDQLFQSLFSDSNSSIDDLLRSLIGLFFLLRLLRLLGLLRPTLEIQLLLLNNLGFWKLFAPFREHFLRNHRKNAVHRHDSLAFPFNDFVKFR